MAWQDRRGTEFLLFLLRYSVSINYVYIIIHLLLQLVLIYLSLRVISKIVNAALKAKAIKIVVEAEARPWGLHHWKLIQ